MRTRNRRVALPLLSRNRSGPDFERHRYAASALHLYAPAASLSVRTFLHERSHRHLAGVPGVSAFAVLPHGRCANILNSYCMLSISNADGAPQRHRCQPIIILLQAVSSACDEGMTPFSVLTRNRDSPETVVSFRRCYAETAAYAVHSGSTMRGFRYFAPAGRFYL